MYNLKHLLQVALSGVRDMRPALRRAFNDNPTDDRLHRVFGPSPRARIVLIIVAAVAVGEWVRLLTGNARFNDNINVSALCIGIIFTVVFRRYIFRSGEARADDFPWLAASVIPAVAALVLISVVRQFATGAVGPIADGPMVTAPASAVVAIARAYGIAAAFALALAALCFSRNWLRALKDLIVQLAVFEFMLWITVLVVVEIGIVGQVLAAVIESIFGIRFPGWLGELSDQLSLTLLLGTVYTAIIGATWMVCRQRFGELLATGEVRVIAAVRDMAKKPKKPKKPKAAKKKAGKRRRWWSRQKARTADD